MNEWFYIRFFFTITFRLKEYHNFYTVNNIHQQILKSPFIVLRLKDNDPKWVKFLIRRPDSSNIQLSHLFVNSFIFERVTCLFALWNMFKKMIDRNLYKNCKIKQYLTEIGYENINFSFYLISLRLKSHG